MNIPQFTRKRVVVLSGLALLVACAVVLYLYGRSHKEEFAASTLSLVTSATKLLPIEGDTRKEIEVVDALVSRFTKGDGTTYSFLLLLQNNYELRPGGGFLGQYAVLKVRDGKILSFAFEDANLLDQRITTKVTPPWQLKQYMRIKNWKFRDSNFSPDFPTNAAKAEYFYRLAGGRERFDGVIAINADVLNHVIGIVGPITIPGYGTYAKENAAIDLEEDVEKAFLGDDVPAELKQSRKDVMKRLAAEIIGRIDSLGDVGKLASLGLEELRDKNVQLNFKDEDLQKLVSSVHWDGSVAKDWTGDSLFIVDANMGALKTDYFIRRTLEYTVDFTGEVPRATVLHTYAHTAPRGDWRTSDYHTYTRIYAPLGSTYVDQSRLNTGGVSEQDSEDFNRTVFGYKVDALIGTTLPTSISYTLPPSITADGYELLIQKQSGIGTIPITVTVKTHDGEYKQSLQLKKDLRLSLGDIEEGGK